MDRAGKRSDDNMDPDYENPGAELRKRQRVMELDAKDYNVKKIVRILTEQLDLAIDEKKHEALEIDRRLNEARITMDSLRACIVAKYYSASSGEQDLSNSQQSAVHPAVKQLSGKKPVAPGHASAAATPSVGAIPRCASECLVKREICAPANAADVVAAVAAARGSAPPAAPNVKLTKRLIVGNVSKYIPDDRRDDKDMATHKWMIYVRGPREQPDVSRFVRKVWFFLHPSYKPNDLVEVARPPFHLTRRGWGEFPVRVQVHLSDARGRKIDVIHNLKLDRTYTGLQTLGAETHVDVELDLTSPSPELPLPTTAPQQRGGGGGAFATASSPHVSSGPVAAAAAAAAVVHRDGNGPPSSGLSRNCLAVAGSVVDAAKVAALAASSLDHQTMLRPSASLSSLASSSMLPSSQERNFSTQTRKENGVSGSVANRGTVVEHKQTQSAVVCKSEGSGNGGELTVGVVAKPPTPASAAPTGAADKKPVDAVAISLLLPRPSTAVDGSLRDGAVVPSGGATARAVSLLAHTVPSQQRGCERAQPTSAAAVATSPTVYVRCQDGAGRQYLIKREALSALAVGGTLRPAKGVGQVSDSIKVVLANGACISSAAAAVAATSSAAAAAGAPSSAGCAAARGSAACRGQPARADTLGSSAAAGLAAASVGRSSAGSTLKPSDFANVDALIACLVKRHPLVLGRRGSANGISSSSREADGACPDDPMPPYCAPSRDVFASWPLGKRRASEWLRACDVRKAAAELLGGENARLRGEPLWSTKRILHWCRLHLYSPEDGALLCKSAAAAQCPSEVVIRCTPSADVLGDVADGECVEQCVDVVSLPVPVPKLPSTDAQGSGGRGRDDEIALTAEQRFVGELVCQLGIRTAPDWTVVMAPDRAADLPASAPVGVATCESALYGAMLAFCEDLLRRAAASSKVKQHSEIVVADVIDAIQMHEPFDFLSDKYMGE